VDLRGGKKGRGRERRDVGRREGQGVREEGREGKDGAEGEGRSVQVDCAWVCRPWWR